MNYKKVRELSPMKYWKEDTFSGNFISSRISPFFTILFVRWKVIPNRITIYMILAGIIGAVLFSLPFVYLKILGFILFHLWFILDCSDGEVARITKKFSTFGNELDSMAHLINHPLFNFSLFLSYYQLNKYDITTLLIIFLALISFEMLNRSILLMVKFIEFKLPKKIEQKQILKTSTIKFLINQLAIYPNFVLLFPFVFFADYYFNFNSLLVLVIWTILFVLLSLYSFIKTLKQLYQN